MTSKSHSDKFFRGLYESVSSSRPHLISAIVLALAVSAILIADVQLDMSFNPFFSNDKKIVAVTEELEEVFGQRLGSYFGVIVENENILSETFLRTLDWLSLEIERIDHITEVVSLTRFAYPTWTEQGVRSDWILTVNQIEGDIPEPLLEAVSNNPSLRRLILSDDGKKTLILARPSLARSDLTGRSEVIDEFRTTVESALASSSTLHFVGYSVVENAFAAIVLRSLAQTFVLTFLALMVFLWIVYRRVMLVVAALAGVVLATPVSIGAMVLLGQDVTMINSMVPVVILIIGVADAVHMIQSYLARRRQTAKPDAIREMFVEMGLPCMLTTVTTAAGFLGLCVAEITAIRDFGLNVCIGVFCVYVFNLIVLPYILTWSSDTKLKASPAATKWAEKWALISAHYVIRRSHLIATGFVILTVIAAVSIPKLNVDQHVNGEIAPDAALRLDQNLLETEFGGFLGPDVGIRRRDGQALTTPSDIIKIRDFVHAVSGLEDVDRVESITDFLPPNDLHGTVSAGLEELRVDDKLGLRVRALISENLDRTVISVYVSDVGTRRAIELVSEVERMAHRHLGQIYETKIFGQWWLAQQGMQNMSRDMLFSFATSLLLILPLLALALRNAKLFLVSLLPNLLPMVFALAFAIWLGIPIRIGTAMVLAIALGIAVDDSIHMMVRLKRELLNHIDSGAAVRAAMKHTGAALLFTSVILVMGFLTMLSNELLAIQDMGVLAAGTLIVAFLSDVFLAPALFMILWGRSTTRAKGYFLIIPPRPVLSAAREKKTFLASCQGVGQQANTLNREVEK